MLEYLTVGEIINVHGVRGAVKVMPETDDPARFKKLKTARIVQNGTAREYAVKGVQLQNRFVILQLEGITDREAASLLRGATVEVARKDAAALPPDAYYIGDLVGCRVTEPDGSLLGTVEEVLETGSNDVYSVRTPQGKNILLPAIARVIRSVDIEKGEIVAELLPGLREIYL